MNWKIKTVIAVLLVAAYGVFQQTIGVILNNQIAVNQLEDTNSGFTNLVLYQNLLNWGVVVIITLILLLFLKEIKLGINKLKEI